MRKRHVSADWWISADSRYVDRWSRIGKKRFGAGRTMHISPNTTQHNKQAQDTKRIQAKHIQAHHGLGTGHTGAGLRFRKARQGHGRPLVRQSAEVNDTTWPREIFKVSLSLSPSLSLARTVRSIVSDRARLWPIRVRVRILLFKV